MPADKATIDGLLEGAFDTHIHSAPDVLPRKFNDLELAERFKARHMGGFVLKSHYICTADRATLVNQMFPEIQAFGAIAMNNSVGGLNPLALDIAGRLGTKVCFLPSVDNANELEAIAGQRDESKLPYWMSIAREMRALGIAGNFLNVTEDGKVTQATRQCLEIVAKHDMVLATSHIRPSEMVPVVKAAREAKVNRIVITHPEFPTTLLSIEQQQELAKLGAYFERCFTTPNTGKISWEQVYANIREVGPETTILATDLGQSTAPYPDEGLEIWAERLLDNGFTEGDLRKMLRDNPAQLLGAKATGRSRRREVTQVQSQQQTTTEAAVVLSARGLSKSYGPFKAVDGVDLDVHEHDIHVFIGPNGAGKSTVLNLLGGQILPTSGDIFFEGRPLGTTTPSWRARAGIGRSFQLTSIVPGFTCLENVVLAVQAHRGLFGLLRLHSRKPDVALAEELLDLVDLQSASDVPAELLSHGQQRQLEIAVALGGRPRLLLLDEPSSGMSAHERAGLGELLKRVVNTATVVMAEHDVHVVRTVASRVTAFAEGKKIAEGSADDVFDSADVKRVFLRGRRDA